jgi:hypothetical protein
MEKAKGKTNSNRKTPSTMETKNQSEELAEKE